MSLSDKFSDFIIKHFSNSTKDEPKDSSDFKASNYDSRNRKFSMDKLTQEKRRKTAFSSPLYMKGLKKKSSDTFKAWHSFEKIITGKKPSQLDLMIIEIFNRKANTKLKTMKMDRCSHIYGDGFILIKYLNDNKAGKDGSPDLSLPPDIKKGGAEPYDLMVLDSERITEFKWKDSKWEKLNVQHLLYKTKKGKEIYIHPDRILHVARNELPFSKLGVSDIDILIDILNSYSDINTATGEILKWFSHGIINVTKPQMLENERDEILKELAKHNNIYANDSKYEMDVVKPEAINPKEFYAWIVQNIAAVLVMPTHLLLGIQVGRVTGAEIGFTDYYNDIKADQEILYTPIFIKLYSQLLESKGRIFNYDIIWNQIFISELAEAEIDFKRAEAIEKLVANGTINRSEAREKHNKGHIELDPNKKETEE